jgi:hypothetical protein
MRRQGGNLIKSKTASDMSEAVEKVILGEASVAGYSFGSRFLGRCRAVAIAVGWGDG